MSDRVIARADLTQIERSLSSVDLRLTALGSDQQQIAVELLQLRADFTAFVAEDARQKELQLAETRLVKVRQTIEERFGFYAEVRRRATGIAQALDAGVVTHQSVQDATEEMMISAPGYWLAPALVALAGWIRDERPLAEKALAEAVRRDEYKTSLYFALVLRRYDRRGAAAAWLGRFYAHQDPTALDREFVVLLDAVAGGVFGPEARAITRQHTAEWLNDLAQKPGFVPEQERRWAVALRGLTPATPAAAYPTLEKYSPTWPAYRASLLSAHLHARVRDYFANIFEGDLAPSPRLREEVDRLLARLVTEYDDEELPLRARERELEIIVDENGDVHAARRRMASEKEAFDEKSDFTQLLTNAAMHPESSGATRATQRYAVALSRDWVVAAYDGVTAQARAAIPGELVLEVEGWRGVVRDGSEEQPLADALNGFFRQKEEAELRDADRSMGPRILLGLGIAVAGYGVVTGFSFLLLVVGIALILFGVTSLNGRKAVKAKIQEKYATARTEGTRIVRAAVAEAVDARAELAREDARAEETRALLLAISPDQYTLSRENDPRAVIA
ncbi:MAG TPA: hypothetical protein VHG93_01805 [Longimicrobium sp.]|nr:hypothetical protein [Longimicrobium sp.]